MQTISRSALVEHSAGEMYALVCDIEQYPAFLPWCGAATVKEASATHQVASVSISRMAQKSTFTTRNALIQDQRIDMQLLEGPFRKLKGTWLFKPLSEAACKIELEVEFEFSNAVVAKMFMPAFEKACNTVMDSFIQRARQQAKLA